MGLLDRLCYVEPRLPQLVISDTWDLCRISWLPLLRGTFVASVGCLRYVGPLSPQLVTFTTSIFFKQV